MARRRSPRPKLGSVGISQGRAFVRGLQPQKALVTPLQSRALMLARVFRFGGSRLPSRRSSVKVVAPRPVDLERDVRAMNRDRKQRRDDRFDVVDRGDRFVCKPRPLSGRSKGGGSRPFIPYCERKKT